MGKEYDEVDGAIRTFIEAQPMFFVASAPLSETGRVNVSPKGLDTFRVLGPKQVAYLDLVGSGVETIAHLRENGRLTMMFMALNGPPKIVRLQGRGRAVLPDAEEFAALSDAFEMSFPGVRSIIVMDVERISDSCGYAVPKYSFVGDRDQLIRYSEKKGPEGMEEYKRQKNRVSIDGLAGLDNI